MKASVKSAGVEGRWMFLAPKNIDSTGFEIVLGVGAVDDWELRAFVLAVVRFDAYAKFAVVKSPSPLGGDRF